MINSSLIRMCNTLLERSYQKLQLYAWKFFNVTIYEKVISLQNCETCTLKILRLSFWIFEFFCHFDVIHATTYIIYYRGENEEFTKSKLWWILWMFLFCDLVHAPICLYFSLITLFLALCKLISFWIQCNGFVLV